MTDAVPSFYMACKEGEDNLTGEKNKNHRQRKIAYVLCCSLLVGAAVVCLKKWVFPRLGDTGETNTRITRSGLRRIILPLWKACGPGILMTASM